MKIADCISRFLLPHRDILICFSSVVPPPAKSKSSYPLADLRSRQLFPTPVRDLTQSDYIRSRVRLLCKPLGPPQSNPRRTRLRRCRCIYCGFCEEPCPVDAIVETRIFEYYMEKRDHNIMTKEKLLGIGDKYETMIAADKAADAVYR